ncbi:MAG: Veg family protein [Clostridia bacterium]|jgi:uncharacterized protein Veg|nr:Veg family protein [Clostridia bacterium]
MIKTVLNLQDVKDTILKLQPKNVEVTLNLGRNKVITFLAKISGVYPALFTVAPFDKEFKVKTSYSYSEYLCGRVKVKEKRL